MENEGNNEDDNRKEKVQRWAYKQKEKKVKEKNYIRNSRRMKNVKWVDEEGK
jgi:hypothetical protein